METHIYTTPTSVICIDEETGKAVWKLTTKQVAALREAGEKMAEVLRYEMNEGTLTDEQTMTALIAWEAANK